MDRDLTVVSVRNVVQLRPEGVRQFWLVVVQVHCDVTHNGQELLGRRQRRPHRVLDFEEMMFALAPAANAVVSIRDDAVGGAVEVVRDDHVWPKKRGRLVQCAEVSEVFLGLAEPPLPVQSSAMEVRQPDSSFPVVVQVQERRLHSDALGVPEAAEGQRHGPGRRLGVCHRIRRAQGAPCTGWTLLRHFPPTGMLEGQPQPAEEVDEIGPVLEGFLDQRRVGLEHRNGLCVVAHQPMNEIVLHQSVELVLCHLVRRRETPALNALQRLAARMRGELLEHGDHHHGVLD
mmetsp:Transcript_32443/g.89741  ORF Transcript_32443/g.89741 Transcript_32443/m.89741 type:complete len:288 (-) Transcript_32443:135-998(-)